MNIGDLVKSIGTLNVHYDDGTHLRTDVVVGIIIDIERAANEDTVVCVHWQDSEQEWILDKELKVIHDSR